MSLQLGKVDQLRQEAIDYLESIPFFDDITIVTEDKGDVQANIDRALGVYKVKDGKAGVVIIWVTARCVFGSGNDLGTVIDPLKFALRILENVKVNRSATGTNKTPQKIGEELCAAFNGSFTALTANEPLLVDEPGLIPANDPKYPGKDLFLKTSTSINITLPKLVTPTVTYDGTLVEMVSADDAPIYYTTNGKKPNPRNSTRYTGQFTIADPTTIKARAILAGYLHSDIALPVAGDVIPTEEPMDYEGWRATLNAKAGNLKVDSSGNLLLKHEDGNFYPVEITTSEITGNSVVADAPVEEIP